MRFGAVFPQIEFPPDPVAVRDYAQAVEGMGFHHVLAYDHVLGANPERPGGWQGPYIYKDPFLSPFLLFSFMAALTTRLELVTGVIILPQRQTALAAKQAATLDVLCGGRFRMGIGLGWNAVEYEALGEDFHTRGRRIEEQVTVMRRLWTEPLVTFEGRWHTIHDAGLNPLPVQRPIPVWFGGHADPVLKRVAAMGDGWMPTFRTAAEAQPSLRQIDAHLAEAGRSRTAIGIEPRLHYRFGQDDWLTALRGWQEAGATHISINTMGAGLKAPGEHIAALRTFAASIGLAP
jgi:probable F420-dependent oxidoreductase